MFSEFDPKVISAVIGAVAVLISAVISYIVSKRIEQRKNTIEYLKNKIAMLEEKKTQLLSLSRSKTSGKVTPKNLAQKTASALEEKYDKSIIAFLAINHYLPASSTTDIKRRIKRMDGSLARARGDHLLGKPIEKLDIDDPIEGSDAVSEMLDISKSIQILIEDELISSVESIEKISGLKR